MVGGYAPGASAVAPGRECHGPSRETLPDAAERPWQCRGSSVAVWRMPWHSVAMPPWPPAFRECISCMSRARPCSTGPLPAGEPLRRPAGGAPGLRGAARRSRGRQADQEITCPMGQGAR